MLVQRCVWRVAIVEHKHIDEVDEDAWSFLRHMDVEVAPLENDHENQVSKQTQHKNHLRNKLQNDVECFSEVSGGGRHTNEIEHWDISNSLFSPKHNMFTASTALGNSQSCTNGKEKVLLYKRFLENQGLEGDIWNKGHAHTDSWWFGQSFKRRPSFYQHIQRHKDIDGRLRRFLLRMP